MQQKNPLFSVIFVNFRSARLLRDAIHSLPEFWNREIIIVNNDPNEKGEIEQIGVECSAKIVTSPENLGFGAANNLGAIHSCGEFLLFLNPDTLWQWGTFSEIQDFFQNHPKVGAVGVKLVGPDGNPEQWSAGMPLSLIELVRNNLGVPSGKRIWESKDPVGAGWVSGAALFVRKDLFEDIGGFDERFFLYFEDVDLCERIRKAGRSIAFYPGIVVRHLRGGSHDSHTRQKEEFYRSQELYFSKHRPSSESSFVSFFRSLLLVKNPEKR